MKNLEVFEKKNNELGILCRGRNQKYFSIHYNNKLINN